MNIQEAIDIGDFKLAHAIAESDKRQGKELDKTILRDLLINHNPYQAYFCETAIALIEMIPNLKSDRNNYTLFEYALVTSRFMVIKAFLDHGIDVKGRKTLLQSFLTLVDDASEQILIIDCLINNGINVEPGVIGKSLLEIFSDSPPIIGKAEDLNATKLVSYFLNMGVDPNYKATTGEQHSLLFEAVNIESLALVKFLIEADADPDIQTKRGFTPLMNACGTVYPPRDSEVIYKPSAQKNLIAKYLVKIKANINLVANGKRTALSIAKSANNFEILDILNPKAKTRTVKQKLIDKSTDEVIELLQRHEDEATAFMKNESVNGEWPNDKQWLNERKEIWKYYVLPAIKKLFMGNVSVKFHPALRRFFLQGIPPDDVPMNPILEAWLHADGSEKNMIHVLNNYQDFNNSIYYYLSLGAGLNAPYGTIGPRTKTLISPLIKCCFPQQKDIEYQQYFDRDVEELKIKSAYSFVSLFLNKAPTVFSSYENDPHSWTRHSIREFECYLDICVDNFRDSYFGSDISKEIDSFYMKISGYTPDTLPNYKCSYAPEFHTQLKSIVDSSKVSAFLGHFVE